MSHFSDDMVPQGTQGAERAGQGRVLIIAGSDSGGGAGVQADIKTVTMMGGYAMSAITALTIQNTLGVHGIFDVPADIVRQQMNAVLEDIGADALKTGMLHRADIVEAVAEALSEKAPDAALVVDPVMIAKGGSNLLEQSAIDALKQILIPLATIITPNAPEAEVLTGREIVDLDGQKRAADALLGLGVDAVLIKGGHIEGPTIFDVLATIDTLEVFSSPRIETVHTHGTGCTLASAIATGLSFGLGLSEAVMLARDYVHEAIRTAPGFGRGHGPVNHGHPLTRQDLN